jgi:TolB-like protein
LKTTISYALLLAMLAAAAVLPPARAAEPARVLIIPFDINAQPQFGFLREGIYDMLSTRLAIEGKTVLVDRKQVDQRLEAVSGSMDGERAVRIAEEFQADYVLFGSLTLFGETVSTDARFVDVGKGKTVVVFSRTGERHGDVIAHVDQLSAEIKEQAFGLKSPTAAAPPSAPAAPVAPAPPKAAPAPPPTAGTGPITLETERPPIPSSRSRRYNERIDGIAAGDIDGDGRSDIVFVSRQATFAYRIVEGSYRKIGEFDAPSGSDIIGVDAADINQNGRAEIFVTALRREAQRLDSFVVEWNGSEFAKISEDPNWYYRIIEMPDRGPVLLGQQRGTTRLFAPGVNELTWADGSYRPALPLALPNKVNIYGFTYGDVLNDGRRLLAAYDDRNHIRIFDEAGHLLWTSADPYGGSPLYLEHISGPNPGGNPNLNPGVKNRTYLPQRLFIADLNGDGRNEVITAVNKALAGGALQRLKTYSEGRIQVLASQGEGLYPQLKTAQLEGYVSDVALADSDGDGRPEIFFSVVIKTGSMIGTTPKSVIYLLDLNALQGG